MNNVAIELGRTNRVYKIYKALSNNISAHIKEGSVQVDKNFEAVINTVSRSFSVDAEIIVASGITEKKGKRLELNTEYIERYAAFKEDRMKETQGELIKIRKIMEDFIRDFENTVK